MFMWLYLYLFSRHSHFLFQSIQETLNGRHSFAQFIDLHPKNEISKRGFVTFVYIAVSDGKIVLWHIFDLMDHFSAILSSTLVLTIQFEKHICLWTKPLSVIIPVELPVECFLEMMPGCGVVVAAGRLGNGTYPPRLKCPHRSGAEPLWNWF